MWTHSVPEAPISALVGGILVFQQPLGYVEIPRLPLELPEIKAEAQPIRLTATFIAAKGNIPMLPAIRSKPRPPRKCWDVLTATKAMESKLVS
jgi:hypothetical protein